MSSNSVDTFAINRLHLADGVVKKAGSVFSMSKDEYLKLEKLSAVRRATDDEVILSKAKADQENGTTVIETAKETAKQAAAREASEKAAAKAADDQAAAEKAAAEKLALAGKPASGAAGDPAGAPKGGKTDDDLAV